MSLNELSGTRNRESRLAPRLANLYAKKCITFGKEDMVRRRLNKRLPLACRKRGAPASNCRRPKEGRFPRGPGHRLNVTCGRAGVHAERRPRVSARERFAERSDERDGRRHHTPTYPGKRGPQHGNAAPGLATR